MDINVRSLARVLSNAKCDLAGVGYTLLRRLDVSLPNVIVWH